MKLRTDYTELPQIDELLTIISNESTRQVPQSKIESNFNLVDYKPLLDLIEFLNLKYNPEIFSNRNYPFLIGYKEHEIIKENLVNAVFEYLQDTSNNHYNVSQLQELLSKIYSYLTEEDDIKSQEFELGFVFGSAAKFRILKAIELYKLGVIKKIMISGYKPFYKDSLLSEAESLKIIAIENGIPEDKIILETQALTIPDNVKRSLDLFDESKFYPNSIIIITAPFAMRRSYVDWLKFLPLSYRPKILRVNSEISEKFNKENWFKSKETLHVVLNEYFKNRGEQMIDVYLNTL
jgi:hypothetical protein